MFALKENFLAPWPYTEASVCDYGVKMNPENFAFQKHH